MPNALRYLIWSIVSIGMFFLAIMFFWVFLVIVGVAVIGRLLYMKLFNKGNTGTFTIHTYTVRPGPRHQNPSQSQHKPNSNGDYTTVIDADDMEQEYKIPKIK